MAYRTRNVPDAVLGALVAAWNAKQEASVASLFHADITQITSGNFARPTVTNDTPALSIGAAPTDTATAISFSNSLKGLLNRHFADTRAHNSAVTAAMSTADATDLTTAIALGIAQKTAVNAHLTESNVHFNNDGTNGIAAADATNITTLIALLTELRTDVGAHIISAPTGAMIQLVGA
ncbi:hypothetical protein [Caudoviricetes sp.]|nr:hypothetical protein [Caudoviricetes sp.]